MSPVRAGSGRVLPLVASYWTLAGDSHPGAADETSPWPLGARMEAAASAGYSGMGLLIEDVRALLAGGAAREFGERAARLGLSVIEVEVLTNWYSDGRERAESDRALEDFVAFAEQVPVRHLKVGGHVGEVPESHDALVSGLRRVSDRVRHTGMAVTVEFMPFSTIPTLGVAQRAIRDAERETLGILLDVWHVARCGIPYEDLTRLPRGIVNYVEIDDAPRLAADDLFHETVHGRLLPGEGELDVPAFLRAVLELGYDGPIGVEIIGAEHRSHGLAEAARRSFEAADGTLTLAAVGG